MTSALLGWKVEWKNSFRSFTGVVVEQNVKNIKIKEELLDEIMTVASSTRCTKLSPALDEYVKYWKKNDAKVNVKQLIRILERECDSDVMRRKVDKYRSHHEDVFASDEESDGDSDDDDDDEEDDESEDEDEDEDDDEEENDDDDDSSSSNSEDDSSSDSGSASSSGSDSDSDDEHFDVKVVLEATRDARILRVSGFKALQRKVVKEFGVCGGLRSSSNSSSSSASISSSLSHAAANAAAAAVTFHFVDEEGDRVLVSSARTLSFATKAHHKQVRASAKAAGKKLGRRDPPLKLFLLLPGRPSTGEGGEEGGHGSRRSNAETYTQRQPQDAQEPQYGQRQAHQYNSSSRDHYSLEEGEPVVVSTAPAGARRLHQPHNSASTGALPSTAGLLGRNQQPKSQRPGRYGEDSDPALLGGFASSGIVVTGGGGGADDAVESDFPMGTRAIGGNYYSNVSGDARMKQSQGYEQGHPDALRMSSLTMTAALVHPPVGGEAGRSSFPAAPGGPGGVSQAQAQAHPPLPSSITWQRGEVIGCGSFGRVYSGLDLETGERIAVKEVRLGDGKRFKQQAIALQREIKLLSELQHRNIIQYLGAELAGEVLRIFLELAVEGSVKDALNEFGAFNEPLLRRYTHDIVGGLSYLHAQRIIHRDIKPSNLLLVKNVVKIADFGCSTASVATDGVGTGSFKGAGGALSSLSFKGKANGGDEGKRGGECNSDDEDVGGNNSKMGDEGDRDSRRRRRRGSGGEGEAEAMSAMNEMNHGTIAGTTIYMAPEAMKGADTGAGGYGRKADVWSLGITLAEMANGKAPFNNAAAAIFAVCVSKALPTFPQHMSPDAHHFLSRCLAEEVQDRANCSELLRHEFLQAQSADQMRAQTAASSGMSTRQVSSALIQSPPSVIDYNYSDKSNAGANAGSNSQTRDGIAAGVTRPRAHTHAGSRRREGSRDRDGDGERVTPRRMTSATPPPSTTADTPKAAYSPSKEGRQRRSHSGAGAGSSGTPSAADREGGIGIVAEMTPPSKSRSGRSSDGRQGRRRANTADNITSGSGDDDELYEEDSLGGGFGRRPSGDRLVRAGAGSSNSGRFAANASSCSTSSEVTQRMGTYGYGGGGGGGVGVGSAPSSHAASPTGTGTGTSTGTSAGVSPLSAAGSTLVYSPMGQQQPWWGKGRGKWGSGGAAGAGAGVGAGGVEDNAVTEVEAAGVESAGMMGVSAGVCAGGALSRVEEQSDASNSEVLTLSKSQCSGTATGTGSNGMQLAGRAQSNDAVGRRGSGDNVSGRRDSSASSGSGSGSGGYDDDFEGGSELEESRDEEDDALEPLAGPQTIRNTLSRKGNRRKFPTFKRHDSKGVEAKGSRSGSGSEDDDHLGLSSSASASGDDWGTSGTMTGGGGDTLGGSTYASLFAQFK